MLTVKNKSFVEGGFSLPDCKSDVAYKDRDTLLVGTDFPGRSDSMTDSGYPRTVNEWKRGTPLSSAQEVFECGKEHIAAHGWVEHDHGETYEWHYRSLTVRAHPLFSPPRRLFPKLSVLCPADPTLTPSLVVMAVLHLGEVPASLRRRLGQACQAASAGR